VFCLECGNCRKGDPIFYCTAKNDFVIVESKKVKERGVNPWRKGAPSYEKHRRQLRKDKVPQLV